MEITEALGSGAAHIFDIMQGIFVKTWTFYGREGMSLVAWFGSGVSWDCGSCFYPAQASFGNPAVAMNSQIFLGGDPANAEYFASAVISHEHGHWVMQNFGESPNEGGTHYMGIPTFPNRPGPRDGPFSGTPTPRRSDLPRQAAGHHVLV